MKKLTLIICLTLVSGFAFSQWVQQKSNDVLFSVYFPDANTGYAVGGHDGLSKPDPHQIILKTITGGTTWTTLSSGRYEPLYSVFFTDINTGYAVGMGGTIIKTTDGGINWIYLSSGTPYTLSAVFFTDAKTGYVVGILGIILKTIDGGTTWDTLSSGTSVPLKSVFFTDLKTGYAAGGRLGDGGGIILKTIDGGKTWTELSTIITDGSINSVFFTNADTGYAVGSHYYEGAENYEGGGIILKTTNGGTTWDTLSSGISVPLKSVFFTDVKTGYAVGGRLGYGGGVILKTIDGGNLWTELSTGMTEVSLTSVFFTNTDTGYAVGSNGAAYWDRWGGDGIILKTTNGGGFPTLVENVLQESSFTVYPNPATNKISIETHSNLQGETTICIFNMNGAILQQEKFQSQNLIEMDVSAMAKGIYLLQMQTKAGVESKKLVVQ